MIACGSSFLSAPACLGDTFHKTGQPTEPLATFTPQKAMVYAGLYPYDTIQFPKLDESVRKVSALCVASPYGLGGAATQGEPAS